MTDYIKELSRDWLDRSGTTFVRKRKDGRLGWEETLKPGQGYSAFLLDAPDQKELLKRAYPLAKNVISAMDLPYKVHVCLSSNSSLTDYKSIYVATDVFNHNEIETGRQLDVFLGYTVHEGSHILYTDHKVLKQIRMLPATEAKWVHWLENVIEDEYIERRLGEEKPGLANFLEATKSYVFGQNSETDDEPFIELVNSFLALVRYPPMLTEEKILTYGEYLLKARDILTPFPQDTEESLKAAKLIYTLFKDFIKENPDTDKDKTGDREESEGGEDSQNDTDCNPGETDGGNESDNKDNDPEDGDSEGKKESEGTETEDDAEKTEDGKPSGSPLTDKEAEKILDTVFDALRDKLEALAPDTKDTLERDEEAETLKENPFSTDIIEGTLEEGSAKDTFFENMQDDREQYMKSYGEISQYVYDIRKSIKTHFKEFQFCLHGQKHGRLETRKLANAYIGSRNVYVRKSEVTTDKIAVCILIDESGSMGGAKEMAARKTAILLNEALSGMPDIDLFIYGHTGDIKYSGATELMVYKDMKHHPRYALGNVQARCQNRDGTAILEVARRVRKQTDRPVLMFILSDGEPWALNYCGRAAINDVRRKVKMTEAMGFTPVQICIDSCYNPAEMFRNYLFLTDMSKLAPELTRTIRDAMKKNTKNHIA